MNSAHSCAARVLLWANTSVGRWTCSMTLAIVKVLPDPVTPSKVCSSSPLSRPMDRASMAWGWSPAGV